MSTSTQAYLPASHRYSQVRPARGPAHWSAVTRAPSVGSAAVCGLAAYARDHFSLGHASTCGDSVATHKSQNQEWPFAGFWPKTRYAQSDDFFLKRAAREERIFFKCAARETRNFFVKRAARERIFFKMRCARQPPPRVTRGVRVTCDGATREYGSRANTGVRGHTRVRVTRVRTGHTCMGHRHAAPLAV